LKQVSFADVEKVAVGLKGMDGDEDDTDEASDVAEATKTALTKVQPEREHRPFTAHHDIPATDAHGMACAVCSTACLSSFLNRLFCCAVSWR
jgi:hypothetical protein